MTARAHVPVFLLVGGAAVAVAGCTSTQDKSAEIQASLGKVQKEKGLKIKKESKVVKVVDTTLLSDKNGDAVVVRLRNESHEDLTDVPIAIDVLGANGKSVYENDIPGIEPALTSMPLIEAEAEVDWVHNQLLTTGKAKEVEVEVGASKTTLDQEPPEPDITVGPPKLEKDPVSGVQATGEATNNTGVKQGRLLLFGVARQGDEIVAAGRGAIDKLGEGKSRDYHIFFIGDPTGADVEVTSFPNQPEHF